MIFEAIQSTNIFFKNPVAIAAIVISLIALAYSIYEGRQSRIHNRIMVKPYLDFSINYSSIQQEFSIKVHNKGFGPALIKTFDVVAKNYNMEQLKEKGIINFEHLSKFIGSPNKFDWQFLQPWDLLDKGESVMICSFKYKKYTPVKARVFREAISNLNLYIVYSCMYEKKEWSSNFIGKEKVPLEEQPTD